MQKIPGRSPVGRVGHRQIDRELVGMAMGIPAGCIVARVCEIPIVRIPGRAPWLHPPDDDVSMVPASGDRLARVARGEIPARLGEVPRGKGDQGVYEAKKGVSVVECDDDEEFALSLRHDHGPGGGRQFRQVLRPPDAFFRDNPVSGPTGECAQRGSQILGGESRNPFQKGSTTHGRDDDRFYGNVNANKNTVRVF